MTKRYATIIIGGGAAGIVSAISAKRKGNSVIICERMPRLGKKILASGNGRCNLSNEHIDESCYNDAARELVTSIFSRFGKKDILAFFKELGLEMYAEDGRIFPVTNQASSVVKILELELKRLSIPVALGCTVVRLADSSGRFVVETKEKEYFEGDKVIIAGGGKSYPALGSDGSSYALAKRFGHNIIEPIPTAVPVVVKDRLCHILQGQKITACAKSIINDVVSSHAAGELLFTKYGLSGTVILDISEEISLALNRRKQRDAVLSVDMVPFMSLEALHGELSRRVAQGVPPEELLAGILPNKFGAALSDILKTKDPGTIASMLKDKRFNVLETKGWNEAEFTAGGVDTRDINKSTLESKLKKGLYFAGEVLDVHGKRGGYNLAWAWASGFVAGRQA